MNLQSNQARLNQPQEMHNVLENLKSLTKEDIYAQTRYVNNFTNDDESCLDSNKVFNGYIEEYE